MTLAMAAVGDLVSPRERARYQGYIAATFAVATIAGPLLGGLLVDHVELALGLLRQPAARPRRARRAAPAPAGARRSSRPSGRARPGRRRAARRGTSALMLACIWGGNRYAWDSVAIVGLLAAAVLLTARADRARAAGRRPGRPARPAAHPHGRRSRRRALPDHRGAVLGQRLRAALPADHDGREPDRGRAAARAGDARDHAVDEPRRPRDRAQPGRYKRFPVAGLALMTAALFAARRRRRRPVADADRPRARRVRARLRPRRPGADRRRAERRRPAPARRRDGDDELLPRPRRRGRRGRARRRVRRPRRHRRAPPT